MRTHVRGPGEIFVFGSNLAGIHGAGAAKTAKYEHGAIQGIGQGHMGTDQDGCYALPTCSFPGLPLSFEQVKVYVEAFLIYARYNPTKTFFVTRVGCGIAGFTDDQIGPLFKGATINCILPPEWDEYTKLM